MDKDNFKNYVYEDLKKKIVMGELQPGAVINEKIYAQEMGVSRTPVHEAVQRLAHEGMVVIIPRCGTIVSHISVEDVRQLYELRKMLEPQIVKLAAERADREKLAYYRDYYADMGVKGIKNNDVKDNEGEASWLLGDSDNEFHMFLAESTGNRFIIEYIKEAMTQTMRIRCLSNEQSESRFLSACNEHVAIIDAMLKGDGESAALEMTKHLENSEKGFKVCKIQLC